MWHSEFIQQASSVWYYQVSLEFSMLLFYYLLISLGVFHVCWQVDGFPTLFLYKDGSKVSEYNGDRSLNDMVNFISRNLEHDEL